MIPLSIFTLLLHHPTEINLQFLSTSLENKHHEFILKLSGIYFRHVNSVMYAVFFISTFEGMLRNIKHS